ncbi:MAG: hypothetical protein L6R45_01930 [Anaerolineae bacterium]|nr:hypothetical protein [Anaerolineae bacterium]
MPIKFIQNIASPPHKNLISALIGHDFFTFPGNKNAGTSVPACKGQSCLLEDQGSGRAQPLEDPPGFRLHRLRGRQVVWRAAAKPERSGGGQAAGGFICVPGRSVSGPGFGVIVQRDIEPALGCRQLSARLARHRQPHPATVLFCCCLQLAAEAFGGGEVARGHPHAHGGRQEQGVTGGAVTVALAHRQAQVQSLVGGSEVACGKAIASHSGIETGQAVRPHEGLLGRHHTLFQCRQPLRQLAAGRLEHT